MTLNNLSVDLSNNVAQDGTLTRRVVLEQIKLEDEKMSLSKLYKMWQKSLTGGSAGRYKPLGCPIAFDGDLVTIWFDFYVYPIPTDLEYTLTPSIGELNDRIITNVTKSHDSIFTMSNTVDVGYSPKRVEVKWLTMCYLSGGGVLPYQNITIDNNLLTVPTTCFGVVRVDSEVEPHKYRLIIELIKKEGEKLTLTTPVITASWENIDEETETEQLQLEIPECVEYALAMCDGDLGYSIGSPNDGHFVVYYSICDGSYITTRKVDKENWYGNKQVLGLV